MVHGAHSNILVLSGGPEGSGSLGISRFPWLSGPVPRNRRRFPPDGSGFAGTGNRRRFTGAATGHWLLVTGRWLLVPGRWLAGWRGVVGAVGRMDGWLRWLRWMDGGTVVTGCWTVVRAG